jgi:hypothetical protein
MFFGIGEHLPLRRVQSLDYLGNRSRRVKGAKTVFRLHRATSGAGCVANGKLQQVAVAALVTQLNHVKATRQVQVLSA